ncbi:MAG: protein phosphatase 2C domain-containing protein [Bryobacteraceae bacterium]
MSFRIDIAQHIGSREAQLDACLLRQNELSWLAVACDGMGGFAEAAGSAHAAAEAFAQDWNPFLSPERVSPWLDDALIRAQSAVLDLGARSGISSGVAGTTLLAAASVESRLWWISAGDTSLFLLRDGIFELLNILHLHEVKGGAPRSYLGAPEIREVDRCPSPLSLRSGDLVMLATDGLTLAFEQEEIGAILLKNRDIGATDLIGRALARDLPAQDNLTVVLVRPE